MRGAVGWIGLAVLVVLVAGAPWWAPDNPLAVHLGQALQAPNPRHWLGTDQVGRDIWSRLLYGGRVTLAMAAVAAVMATATAVVVGMTAGFWIGWGDLLLMRVVDGVQAVPSLVLGLGGMAIWGHTGWPSLVVAISFGLWAEPARWIRAETRKIRGRTHVESARLLGASDGYLLYHHVMPELARVLAAAATVAFARAVYLVAALSFLGMGIQPPVPNWGGMLASAANNLWIDPWQAFWPGIMIAWSVVSAHVVAQTWSPHPLPLSPRVLDALQPGRLGGRLRRVPLD